MKTSSNKVLNLMCEIIQFIMEHAFCLFWRQAALSKRAFCGYLVTGSRKDRMLQTGKLCNLEQKDVTHLRSSLVHTHHLVYTGSKENNDQKDKQYLERAHFVIVYFCYVSNFEK